MELVVRTSFLVMMMVVLLVVTPAEATRERTRPGHRQRWTSSSPVEVELATRSPESETLSELLENPLYNNEEPPLRDRPTAVQLGIYINSFDAISEATMDYQVSFYHRQSWIDPRLKFDRDITGGNNLRLGDNSQKMMWTPDTFIRNEKRASFHDVTTNNRLVTLRPTGDVWHVSKITATLSCQMDLQNYPFDTQHCPMIFESFGYTMETMYFQWLDPPVQVAADLKIPQFSLIGQNLSDCSQNYTTGAYPCLQIDFVLRRNIGYFLIQVFIPCILIVILSWVSFWLNTDAIPARVLLSLLTVLTMTTQSARAYTALPRVSYIKAIDVWMSTCLVFVFAALLEFAVVSVVSRRGVRAKNPVLRLPSDSQTKIDKYHSDQEFEQEALAEIVAKRHGRRIDRVCLVCFPLAFILFNVAFWVVYLPDY